MRMNGVKTFRRINETEQGIVHGSIGKISNVALSALAKSNHELFIAESSSRERYSFPMVYLIPNNLIELLIRSKNIINSAGLYFGFIKKGKFLISLEGAEFLHEQKCFSIEQQIQVNSNGEKSILYGNKILKKMVVQLPSNLKKNQFLLIFNLSKELIAIGNSQVDGKTSKNLNNESVVSLNLIDKGYYLRKKQ